MCTPRVLLNLVALVAFCSPSTFADTWVVDVGGSGDFTSIQVAIDSVAPGDVLLVEPGSYGSFVLDKPLSILGEPSVRPRFYLGSLATREATLVGLRLSFLRISGASGVVLLDDCFVDGDLPSSLGCDGALIIEDCAQVHIQRSTIVGKEGDYACEGEGLRVSESQVTLTGCNVTGGHGYSDAFWGAAGREAIHVQGDSSVLLAQTDCEGGWGGAARVAIHVSSGPGEDAIILEDALSRCIVRGNADCAILGGKAGDSDSHDAFWPVSGQGKLVLSGVYYYPQQFPWTLGVELPDPAEAFVLLDGADTPTSIKRLEVYGSDQQQLWIVASTQHALWQLGAVQGPLFVDPSASVFALLVTPKGQQLPQKLSMRLPAALAGLEGLEWVFQGFAFSPGTTGPYLATNPVQVVLRH